MNELPNRKNIRIENYDYSAPGAYFITVCTANREKIFWSDRRGELRSPANVPLSDIGIIIDNEIKKGRQSAACLIYKKGLAKPASPLRYLFNRLCALRRMSSLLSYKYAS